MIFELPGAGSGLKRSQLALALQLVCCGLNQKLATSALAGKAVYLRERLFRNDDMSAVAAHSCYRDG